MFFSDNLITFKFLKNKRKTESEVHFEENKNILISAKFYKAIEFAAEAHDGQMRKSTSVPYISHPFAVAAMLQNQGCEEHVIIAGLLHDTVEDTRVTIDDIRHEFGARVADIVNIVTEPNKSIPWKERKRYMIDTIKSANSDAKCVICADKLHNLMSMMHAYETLGEKLWERFGKGYQEQKWYYMAMLVSLPHNFAEHDQKPMFYQYEKRVYKFFKE